MSTSNDTAHLLHHLVAMLSRESDQILMEQLGIGLSQYKILSAIHSHPHIQQKIIASMLGQTEASVSRQVKILQKDGLLIARKNPQNQREHIAELTARGLRLIEAAEHSLGNYHAKFLSGLSGKQQNHIGELLATLHRNTCYMQHPGTQEG